MINTAPHTRRGDRPVARRHELRPLFLCLALCGTATAEPASRPSRAIIDVDAAARVGRVWPEIVGINLDYGGRAALSNPAAMAAVKRIAVRSIRFPNGCEADRYDWKADNKAKMSVEQFLAFCDAVGAEPYYTLNLQGGTEDKQGKPPAGAGIDEIIRYRHTAPNPCGYTDYHYGTLAEALEFVKKYTIERALAGRRPILCYEMGNENWGQGKSDWPPEHYAATVAAYARAMRDLVGEAAQKHAPLKDVRLWITAVGYPMVGNNQDPTQPVDGEVNVRWTRELNALAASGLIDAVQDHFYPYGGDGSDLLVWSHHNLRNILYGRRGVANPNLGGRVDEDVAFRMPIEITEWNVKCWGERRKTDVDAKNLGFEQGMAGWDVQASGPGASARRTRAAGRRGVGLRLTAGQAADDAVTVYQSFDWQGRKAKRVFASAWVRTDQPGKVTARLTTATADGRPDRPLGDAGERHAWRAGHWHKITFGGTVPEGATRLAVGFTLAGAAAADIDGVELFYWDGEHGLAPASVDTAAQQLFLVDAFRIMIEHGVRRAHLHHLFGGYACGIMLPDGRTKENYKVFEFLAGRLGTDVVRSAVACGTFDYDCQADKQATDFNAIPPDVKNVPIVSALAMRDEQSLYVLAINRSTDEPVEATIRVHGARLGGGNVRSLTCEDFDAPEVQLGERALEAASEPKCRLLPHAAYVFRFALAAE